MSEEEKALPCLAVKDTATKRLFSHLLERKGVFEYAVNGLVNDLKLLGYRKLALKSDNEPAIVELLTIAL